MLSQSAFRELRQMPKTIRADLMTWNQVIGDGVNQLQVFAELCAKIFENEKLFQNGSKASARAKRLRRPLKRLDKHIKIMTDILKILRLIQQRTEHMWRRVCLWSGDERFRETQLTKILEFLTKRYDYEWEVKEMVVLELEHVNNAYDVHILLEAWRDNRHAGGIEFNTRLMQFFQSMGLPQSST